MEADGEDGFMCFWIYRHGNHKTMANGKGYFPRRSLGKRPCSQLINPLEGMKFDICNLTTLVAANHAQRNDD